MDSLYSILNGETALKILMSADLFEIKRDEVKDMFVTAFNYLHDEQKFELAAELKAKQELYYNFVNTIEKIKRLLELDLAFTEDQKKKILNNIHDVVLKKPNDDFPGACV